MARPEYLEGSHEEGEVRPLELKPSSLFRPQHGAEAPLFPGIPASVFQPYIWASGFPQRFFLIMSFSIGSLASVFRNFQSHFIFQPSIGGIDLGVWRSVDSV